MADTITFRPDEDTQRALAILTRDGSSVSTVVRLALIDAARVQAQELLRTEATELAADDPDAEVPATAISGREADQWYAVRAPVDARIRAVVFVPPHALSTELAADESDRAEAAQVLRDLESLRAW